MKKAKKRLTVKQKAAASRYRARVRAAEAEAEEKSFKAEDKTRAALDYIEKQIHLNELLVERKRRAAFRVYDGPPTAGAEDFSTTLWYMYGDRDALYATRSVVLQKKMDKVKSAYEEKYKYLENQIKRCSRLGENKLRKINLDLLDKLKRFRKIKR